MVEMYCNKQKPEEQITPAF